MVVMWAIVMFSTVNSFFKIPRQVRKEHKAAVANNNGGTPIYTVRFGEKVELLEFGRTLTLPYSDFIYFLEKKGLFYLWTDRNTYICVRKDSFTVGEAETFRTFIEERVADFQLSKRKFSRKVIRWNSPQLIISTIFTVIFAVWVLGYIVPYANSRGQTTTLVQLINNYWDSELETIRSVKIENGAVVFSTDDYDVYASILRETAGKYRIADGHYYPDIVEYSRDDGELFESKGELLSFGYGKEAVVYGVADVRWWESNTHEPERQKYTIVRFKCRGEEYVLYYRITVNENFPVEEV
ncbi:MAG: YcxB family protein [Oscillospiraceae bacterium]|nr:YcxB family protein [Oscillospiraceae bacterium]